jgi:hypothetical protein
VRESLDYTEAVSWEAQTRFGILIGSEVVIDLHVDVAHGARRPKQRTTTAGPDLASYAEGDK